MRASAFGIGFLITCLVSTAVAAQNPSAFGAGQIRLSHGLVQYEFTGPPDGDPRSCPLVILVGGYVVPLVVWDSTLPALVRQGHCVVRFDFYGRGRSARPHIDYTPGLFAGQIWELVAALALLEHRARFDLVASSMGGPVAAVFATRHSDVVDRIVLVSPAGLSKRFPPITTVLKTPRLGKWYFERRFHPIMLDHLQQNFRAEVCLFPRVLAEVRRQLDIPGTSDAMYSTARLTLLQDWREEFHALGNLHRPTRVIWGSEDTLLPLRDARAALDRAIPHRELWLIRGAAHLPQVERPLAFNELVAQFLRL